MRCPDCCKFVGLETQDPEEENDLEIDDEGHIIGKFRVDRNCQECGTTLKQAGFEFEDDLPEDIVTAHTNEDDKMEPHELSIDFDGADCDESGGGRYAKNFFTVTVNYTVRCACDKEFEHSGSGETGKVAAGEFEECV